MSGVLKKALRDLERSGLTAENAEFAGIYSVKSARDVYAEMEDEPALVLPYYDPWSDDVMTFRRDGEILDFARVRYLGDPPKQRSFTKVKKQRYGQPSRSGVHPYFPVVPDFDWREVAEETGTPLVITEGEKKALRSCLAGVPTIGLGGVYNFMSDGELLAALQHIKWSGRPVYICYDSDAATNPNIQAAEGRLAKKLSLERGATLYLARIPEPRDAGKAGIDDYIVDHGEDAYISRVLETAPRLRKIDSAVLELNSHVAWIEDEGMLLDMHTLKFIRKDHFVRGSKYSTTTIEQPTLKGNGVKKVNAADIWLTHEHAQRFDSVIFDPSTDQRIIQTQEGPAMNMYQPLVGTPGDIQPFLDLTDHVFKELEEEHRELLINLIAYKIQNPARKVPIAPVLIGQQGGGKSMWAHIIQLAVAPYGASIASNQLLSDFNGWVERSLIAVIDEAKGIDLHRGQNVLKSLISEEVVAMNEKYRAARQVRSPTMYILTSNEVEAGAYSHDDRRMFVIHTSPPREDSFYERVGEWIAAGGPKHVLHWFQTMDLGGWKPPKRPPLTQEKVMARSENASLVEQLAETMKTAQEQVVVLWITAALEWAERAELSNNGQEMVLAREITGTLPHMPIRPFYSPDELALMFPALVAQFFGNKKAHGTAAGEISKQLRMAGITYLRSADDPRGFFHNGLIKQYLVIAEMDEYKHKVTQNEFERLMRDAPTYAEYMDAKQRELRKTRKEKR